MNQLATTTKTISFCLRTIPTTPYVSVGFNEHSLFLGYAEKQDFDNFYWNFLMEE